MGALIRSIKFLSRDVVFYLYKSTMRPCMEYCCCVWVGAPNWYLNMKDWWSFTFPESLANRRNIASLSLFYRYYFSRCSFELAELLPLPHFCDRFTGSFVILIGWYIFFQSPFLGVLRMSMPTVPFRVQLDSGILCLVNALPWPMI